MINFTIYNEAGEVLRSGYCPEDMFDLQKSSGEFITEGFASSSFHYVLDNKIIEYTQEELHSKNNMEVGQTWKMPERVVVDLRTSEQKAKDLIDTVRNKRKMSYPPLENLGDALYWQAQGDSTKMEAYIAACKEVKQKHPLPT